jgi:hypothetical protein
MQFTNPRLFIMRVKSDITAALALAASLPVAACHEGPDAEPTDPSTTAVTATAAVRGQAKVSPEERVLVRSLRRCR